MENRLGAFYDVDKERTTTHYSTYKIDFAFEGLLHDP